MAKIRVDLAETLVDGIDIKFKAPCACNEITGLIVYYPAEDETMKSKELVFRDAHGNDLTGIGNLFSKDAYVKIIVDSENGYAYLQNADNNGYLNSAILGTYLHDAENLIGSGENGKFKATVTGTVSSIKVNGVSCSVKCGEDSSMDLIAGCWYTFIRDGNTVNFNTGGAGASQNFKVVGGTTEPVSPKENTIWVNTDTKITDFIFRSTEPEDAQSGAVWIKTSTASSVAFNALKKNELMVYPSACYQFASGSWIRKTAKIYQANAWKDWAVELYNSGNEYTDVTGGWVAKALRRDSSSSAKEPTITKGATSLQMKGSAGNGGIVHTVNKIDLTGRSALVFDGTLTPAATSGNWAMICVWSDFGSTYKDNLVAQFDATSTVSGEQTVDISGLSAGEYYVGFALYGTSSAEMTQMRVE